MAIEGYADNDAATATDATNVTSTYKGNDIDSDGDGTVDAADDAANVTSTYKGNDIDSNGDGKVDSADSADDAAAYDGVSPSDGAAGEFYQTDGTNGSFASVSGGTSIPSDTIAIWAGNIANIPSGWVVCDGLNSTPNLQDRFVVGAGSSYSVDDTGGVDSVLLSTSQLAAHSHGGSTSSDDAHGSGATTDNTDPTGSETTDPEYAYTPTTGGTPDTTTSAGGSHDHGEDEPDLVNTAGVTAGSDFNVVTQSNQTTTDDTNIDHSHEFPDVQHAHNLPGTAHSHGVPVGNHSHSLSINNTGSGSSHENRPPYYALAYMMKT